MTELTPDQKYLAELSDSIEKIWEIARREGLDPYPVNFELVPATIMYEFGSYGLPGRFSHWSRGKAYYRMKTEYDYGLSKIYELVVNTNPSYAFLMEQNDLLQNKVVVAHVLGHTDMFKNNVYFKHTSGNMIDKVSVNADRIRKYEYEHGMDEVERFLDAVLAIEEHIDPNVRIKVAREAADDVDKPKGKPESPYDDLWKLADRKAADDAEDDEARTRLKPRRSRAEPVKDLLLFLAEHAPNLAEWQRDILLIVREEMLYLVPQMQTKVLNEGWACLVGESLVQTEQGLMRFDALHERLAGGETCEVASGGGRLDKVTDRHIRRNAPTIRLRTRRGLVLEGAEEHKLSIGPDQWLALKDVKVGQRIPLSVGEQLWARELVPLATGVLAGRRAGAEVAVAVGAAVQAHVDAGGRDTHAPALSGGQLPLMAPTHLTREFGELLGYLVAGGTLNGVTRAIEYASDDRALVDRYAALVTRLFAIEPEVTVDERAPQLAGGRWR
ncbi:MAG TPA: SpoVR family protein, partial [Ktedonobacterales bacterium]|nr:SpoVR family protein [Ktedonobacterales bacterium]